MAKQVDTIEQISFEQMSLIEKLRDANAVKFGEFELSHGGTSEYYIDKYLFETEPSCLVAIGESIAGLLTEIGERETKLAGVALGAVPLVAVTSVKMRNPYLIVRKSQKDYGTAKRIEGRFSEGEEVVVIEDVATTGNSALSAANALIESGLVVKNVVVVVDRQEGAKDLLAEHDIELHSLLTADALLKVGQSEKERGVGALAD